MANHSMIPKMGPDPILLTRKEIDALYETFDAVISALNKLEVDYIVTGGSLLGAIRQHSILFCDDDIDIAIIEENFANINKNLNGNNNHVGGSLSSYDRVSQNLANLLGDEYKYQIRPWEGGDRVRPKRFNTVFVDIFTLRRFNSLEELIELIGMKKNGSKQSKEYVRSIVQDIQACAYSQNEIELYNNDNLSLCPFWHFNNRKAIEMWRKEVYRHDELFPLSTNLSFGPLTNIKGPRMPVLLLKRAFGLDCFNVYYQSGAHTKGMSKKKSVRRTDNEMNGNSNHDENKKECKAINMEKEQYLPPLVLDGGTWEGSKKLPLEEHHYLPIQPINRAKRRYTLHNRVRLFEYLGKQNEQEKIWMSTSHIASNNHENHSNELTFVNQDVTQRPPRTVYMDGVFDLFHIGHVQAITQCAKLGNRVIIGITGDSDAANYKRQPIISQSNRIAVVKAMKFVDDVICPCPLIVTEDFMEKYGIDLVVHGFASEHDFKQQERFFEIPIRLGKFQQIDYYSKLSTTDIIEKMKAVSNNDIF